MTAVLMTLPVVRFFDANGAPLAGGKVYFYAAGTSTPKNTYTDASGGTPNANPVILDSSGAAVIFMSGSYKINLLDASNVQQSNFPVDNITSFSTGAQSSTVLDNAFTIQNASDLTKQVVFDLSSESTATTISLKPPAGNGTLARLSDVTGGLVLLSTATASASATLDFTSLISSSYSEYFLVIDELLNSASASVGLKISSDNGTGWTTTMYSQLWAIHLATTSAPTYTNVNGATPALISDTQQLKLNGWAKFKVMASTGGIVWEGHTEFSAGGANIYKSFVNGSAAASVNAIRLLPSSGNFTSGTVYLYGIKNT